MHTHDLGSRCLRRDRQHTPRAFQHHPARDSARLKQVVRLRLAAQAEQHAALPSRWQCQGWVIFQISSMILSRSWKRVTSTFQYMPIARDVIDMQPVNRAYWVSGSKETCTGNRTKLRVMGALSVRRSKSQ